MGTVTEKQNYYERLGIKPNASKRDAKLAFNKMALALHTDRYNEKDFGSKEAYQQQMESLKQQFYLLQEAWQTIGNEAKRAEYDNNMLVPQLIEKLLGSSEEDRIKLMTDYTKEDLNELGQQIILQQESSNDPDAYESLIQSVEKVIEIHDFVKEDLLENYEDYSDEEILKLYDGLSMQELGVIQKIITSEFEEGKQQTRDNPRISDEDKAQFLSDISNDYARLSKLVTKAKIETQKELSQEQCVENIRKLAR